MEKDYLERLIKGKIAEIIFQHMFQKEGNYTVIPFGYENTMPELVNCGKSFDAKRVKDNISDSPDFVLVSLNKKSIYLVEVKYRRDFDNRSEFEIEKIKNFAQEQKCRWNPSWIFLATRKGFYFDSCSNIIKNGEVAGLANSWIEKKSQDKYLELLKKYEQ